MLHAEPPKNYACVKNATPFMSRSFRLKVEIGVRGPADHFRLERGPRSALENKHLIGALARWHREVDSKIEPGRVAAQLACASSGG